jgi:hypothetical protein
VNVEPEALDYPGMLAQLTAMLGRDAETIGWDPDVLRLSVGDARLKLHPVHFIDAVHTPTHHGGWLKLVMGVWRSTSTTSPGLSGAP